MKARAFLQLATCKLLELARKHHLLQPCVQRWQRGGTRCPFGRDPLSFGTDGVLRNPRCGQRLRKRCASMGFPLCSSTCHGQRLAGTQIPGLGGERGRVTVAMPADAMEEWDGIAEAADAVPRPGGSTAATGGQAVRWRQRRR
eukprot:GGOE01030055.1.p4 GENE.GGOE01030055.1~~GGOE01030055.1.p4  ORF type:complete len:143 (+),score=7.52 GGOE01030055.1:731-1159(+)